MDINESDQARQGRLVPTAVPEAFDEVVDGEVIVCHPARTNVQVLNGVGSDVWVLIDGRRSVNDIARLLADKYRIDVDRVQRDVLVFVEELRRWSLVTVADPGGDRVDRRA